MFGDYSMFGFHSSNPVDRAAYDMMVLDQIEKDEKELALRDMYGDEESLDFLDEEVE